MEVTITQFRQRVFELVDRALEGKEVWVRHKGRRVRIAPEHPADKLSRITPMEILADGADRSESLTKSWKPEMSRQWEQKWDRRLGPRPTPAAASPLRSKQSKKRRTA
ncbi:hypothetical protein DYQ86_11500 [Acidobacteria bacterium AB60]|nr:hypothetical protein DYQ86_11500 [Acidobacteria bacterium AB60]